MGHADRAAIVTGGGTGIGAAVARRLAASGVAVALVGRRSDALEEVAGSIDNDGGIALTVVADLADSEAPEIIVDVVTTMWGRIDVIVNNAAFIRNHRLEDVDIELFDRHAAVNIRAPLMLIRAALPALKASEAAAVVNVSSSSAALSIPGQSCYGMSKAALEYLTASLAAELAKDGIRVNCVAPGPVDTPIHDSWAEDAEEARRTLAQAVPLRRIAQPDEIAQWVEMLVSPKTSFVTGAIIPIDGGQTLNGALSPIGTSAAGKES